MRFPYRGAGCLLYVSDNAGTVWIYLGRRRNWPDTGKWSIPGGGADRLEGGRRWEPFWKTARRETWEETRIDPSLLESDTGDPPPFVATWFPGFWWRTYFVALDRKPDLRLSWEFTEAGWFPVDHVPKELAFGMKKARRRLMRLLRSGVPVGGR